MKFLSAWAASVVREFLFVHNIRRTDATSTEVYDIVWLYVTHPPSKTPLTTTELSK